MNTKKIRQTKCLSESELESQMDDFAIKNVDSETDSSVECEAKDIKRTVKHFNHGKKGHDHEHAPITSISDHGCSDDNSSCNSVGHDNDPEQAVMDKIVDYYDKNYQLFQIFANQNYIHQ